MFGFEYVLAAIKIMIEVAFAIITAIPLAYAWNRVIPIYFANYLPEVFHNIPYWYMVGILIIATYAGEVIQKLTPKIVRITNNTSK